MTRTVRFLILFITITLFVSAASAADFEGQTNVSAVFSEVIFSPDVFVSAIGYTVNGESGVDRLLVSAGDHIEVKLNYLPPGSSLKTTLEMGGMTHDLDSYPLSLRVAPHSVASSITMYLELVGYSPTPTPSPGGGGSDSDPYIPVVPVVTPTVTPSNPIIPDVPETPDTPGSDEPYRPILPPADSVYNFAGFIPLLAGFFLLFLLVAFRGNLVYRILKKHAKRHGEKPDKEEKKQLKATASAIILLIRDEERYGEWRKNREMEMRLTADIISVLDEMQYPPQIPRGAAAAEILKAAKGRINRHRL